MRRSLPVRLLDAFPLIRPFVGICFRNVAQQYATRRDILSAQGSQFSGGRYNFRGTYTVLYLSCDIRTCVEETSKSFQQAGASVAQSLPRTIVGVEVRLIRDIGVEAIFTPSAALPRTGKNLCIFSDQLLPTSHLRAINGQRLPAV